MIRGREVEYLLGIAYIYIYIYIYILQSACMRLVRLSMATLGRKWKGREKHEA
jgi:hypothetical protein